MGYIERDIQPALIEHLGRPQMTVITGMRRTGKTTLIRHLMEVSAIRQKIYLDLERLDNRELFSEKNYDNIIYALSQRGLDFSQQVLIALDEIQFLKNLPSVLKYLYDTYAIKFLLSGSSSYYLKDMFNESLSGRKKIFELYPLSFGELLRFKGVPFQGQDFQSLRFVLSEYERLKWYYQEYIDYGGFPEVVLTQTVKEKKDLIIDIISAYVNIDVIRLSDFKKTDDVFKLIRLLAARIGNKLDISKLCNLSGISRPLVENYLELFEKSYLIRRLPVFTKSIDREIVKAKKVYFLDNGIASFAADLSSGARFENAVFNQLHQLGELHYYQLKTGKEIDFLLDKKIAFEVKETPDLSDLAKMKDLAQSIGISQTYLVGKELKQDVEGLLWGGSIFNRAGPS